MKKIIMLTVLCSIMTVCVSAKSGDIAGRYYSTDIVTFLNGVEIDAINIGGQTLISAEDMYYHGFNVIYSDVERALWVVDVRRTENDTPPYVKKSGLPSGTPIGYYYETDIVTYLDGKPITAYNLGGRTYIHAEQMRGFNYEVIWNFEERTLSIISPYRTEYYYSIPLSEGASRNGENDVGVGAFSIKYTNDGIIATDDANCFDMTMWCVNNEYSFNISFYQNYRWSGNLINSLEMVAYYARESGPRCTPAEKYEEVNELLTIYVNGHVAKKVAVTCGGGNGHVDFKLSVSDLPRFKKDEIKEIGVAIGNVQGEPYEMVISK